ncbi:RelA/SpoT domain-containing protein [Vibrio splendidus]|uniref:RelA/SpoT domain-containing protein n=1 Tax=Vibrio splendidus TaxID=29497 RepID=UPI003D0DC5AF
MSELQLNNFLAQCNLTNETWTKSNTQVSELEDIAKEFEKLKPRLEQVATGIVGMLQKHSSVHSVRWRIKDTNHLLAKIVRKRAEGIDKYIKLTKDDYSEVITDLVGVRVLHLFKADWSAIQDYLQECWFITEGPTAFIRKGDDKTPFAEYGVIDSEIREHKDDYRSIHNIIESNLVRQPTKIEVQVRTIYEEAWSEIDHKVRYPNYSDNKELKFLLKILNGLSGNADEMGSFVNVLASQIKSMENMEAQMLEHKAALDNANRVKQDQLEQIRQLAAENEAIQVALDKIKEADSDITVLEKSNQATAPINLHTTVNLSNSIPRFHNSLDSISRMADIGLSNNSLDSISRMADIGLSNNSLDSISKIVNISKGLPMDSDDDSDE